MKHVLVIPAIAACFTLAACATTQEQISHKEDLLAAAGFTVKPANTPERESELHRLPPDRFVTRAKGDEMEYLYADPVACNCLYIGNQHAYGAFKKEMFQQRIADEQEMTAMMYNHPWNWDGWNWGPWGPGWWW